MTNFEDEKKDNKINDITNKTQPVQSGKIGEQTSKPDSELADKVGSAVRGDTQAVKDIYNQAKDSAGEVAGKAYDAATEKATSKIGEQKANLAQGLSSVADNIRQMGGSLRGAEQPHGIAEVTAKYSDTLADKVEQFSGYLDKKDLSEMKSDIEDFAHRNPALFLGGAFALGILAARFLKSGNSNQALMRRPRYEIDGKYLPDEGEGVHLPLDLDEQIKSQKDSNAKAANTDDNTSASAASQSRGV
ncbi:MAG: hypothetical protein ACR2MG_10165 [Pyrinomonadaceae bacterium]